MGYLDILQRALEPLPIRGKGRFADFMLSRKQREIACHPVRGATVFLESGQYAERWMWAGAYERQLVALLKRTLRPGMTVFDLGANIGYFSVIAAALVGSKGRVHSFEPMPHNFERLRRNLQPFPWATLHNCAVGNVAKEVAFYFSDKESGWAGVHDLPSRNSRTTAQMIRLDDWLASHPVERIDFIKLDIEGSELNALRGATQLLRRFHPTVVTEAGPNHNHEKMWSFFTDEGYRCRMFNDDCILAEFG